MAARFQCTSSIVVVSSSIMSIDEIFFLSPLREGEFVLSRQKRNWSVSLRRTNVRNKEDSLLFFFKREREIKAIKLMNLSCSENAIG